MPMTRGSRWSSFRFAAWLCGIVLVGNLVGQFATGKTDTGIIVLLCFLPMAFYFADASHSRTREQIEALETRIRQLEGNDDVV